ncbi:MAG: DUF6803 family protein [Mycobacterium leprae]
MDASQMTHYMGLLASNQPWNLIFYMAIPVLMAETLVATEFIVVHKHLTAGPLRNFNKWLGIVLGFYYTGIFLNLGIRVVPTITWNTWVDFIAVWFYLLGFLPLLLIALLELGLVWRKADTEQKARIHFALITIFLYVGHIAMIFGMVNPTLITGAAGGMKM